MTNLRFWDIFCKVIDNFGDIGVCWRLATDLAAHGHSVRLWVDDASALRWMAPSGCEGVRVLHWSESLDLAAAGLAQQPCDVMVEAFGCEIAPEFIAVCAHHASATGLKPVWINLEYLSAEAYVARCHALPSPVQSGPAAGWLKWFFYPGFTDSTGGLLREPGLLERRAGFDRNAWLAAQGLAPPDAGSGEQLMSLFCYEPPALGGLLAQLSEHGLQGRPVRLLVAAGRATQAVKQLINDEIALKRTQDGRSLLSISYLPLFSQQDFDHLLWACDVNFVRGEDSLVRALWAGQPFVWQLYPQPDSAHLEKLQAFLDWLQAPASLRAFHAAWNQPEGSAAAPTLPTLELPAWQACALAARQRLLAQDELCTRLTSFAAKKR